jgi:hypothetical protein
LQTNVHNPESQVMAQSPERALSGPQASITLAI